MRQVLQDSSIAGVVFDLDGTLYDLRPVERWVIGRLLLSLPRLVRYTRVRKELAGIDLEDWAA
ncbi:MAG TPA: hypothetical protein VIK91_26910, partial [Nannocystis sp.]